jgi:hypothetical protein
MPFIIGRVVVKTDSHLGQSVLSGTGRTAIYIAGFPMLLTIAAASELASMRQNAESLRQERLKK